MAETRETVPFNFDEILSEARNLLAMQGFDAADGSNATQLAVVMSYLLAGMNTNTAMNINETLLPFSTKRVNVLQDARVLGYEPRHITSYRYRLRIRIDPKTAELLKDKEIHIPRFSKFSSNGNNYVTTQDYVFVCPKSNVKEIRDKEYGDVLYADDGIIELEVTEGTAYSWENATDETYGLVQKIDSITVNGTTITRNYIDIPYTEIEDSGIWVYVDYSDFYGNQHKGVKFTRTDDFFYDSEDDPEIVGKTFIRQDDIEMGTPRIYFSYGGLGKGLPYGSVVKLEILRSSGSFGIAEKLSRITESGEIVYSGMTLPQIMADYEYLDESGNEKTESINVFENAEILGYDLIQSGSAEETSKSIRDNAPKVFNANYRCVTETDFKAFVSRHSAVLDAIVWGGEKEFPKAPGHVWMSVMPEKSSFRTFTNNSQNTLWIRDNSEMIFDPAKTSAENHETRLDFYQKNYVLRNDISEIFESVYPRSFPGITLHHRNPLYMNFNYKFDIMKYNSKDDVSAFNKKFFELLDGCFRGNDALHYEKFGAEYFHTNVVKRFDYLGDDYHGFDSFLDLQIVLNEKSICTENWETAYKDLYIPLAAPRETVFKPTGELDTSRLPQIDTDFTFGSLKVKFDSFKGSKSDASAPLFVFPILVSGKTSGLYYFFNSSGKREILVHLFVRGNFEGFYVEDGINKNVYYDDFGDIKAEAYEMIEPELPYSTDYYKIDSVCCQPRAYLTTVDKKYMLSFSDSNASPSTSILGDMYYLTTTGYMYDETDLELSSRYESYDEYKGEKVRRINKDWYDNTYLETRMFRSNLYLNVKYPSLNFSVIKNVIPRLNRVEFKSAADTY